MALAVDLVEWSLTLNDGTELRLWADGYSQDQGDLVFTALFRSSPNIQITLARIPESIVRQLRGG